jgi:hypothetical protein
MRLPPLERNPEINPDNYYTCSSDCTEYDGASFKENIDVVEILFYCLFVYFFSEFGMIMTKIRRRRKKRQNKRYNKKRSALSLSPLPPSHLLSDTSLRCFYTKFKTVHGHLTCRTPDMHKHAVFSVFFCIITT